jgi:integral membrane protein (TIGR01906 family)
VVKIEVDLNLAVVDTLATQPYDTTNSADRDVAGRLRPGRLYVALRSLATAIFILAVPLALLTTNIRFVANEPRVYAYAIDQHDAVRTTGIERSELIRGGAELRRFFNNDQRSLLIRVQQDGREVSLFNARETVHLEDVKSRFRLMNRVQELSVLYVLAYVVAVVLWSKEVSPRALALQIATGCGLLLATVALVGAVGMAGFDTAWEDFHQLIFSNDFWRLNPTSDHLIQMFPPAFWESIVFFIGLMTAAEAGLVLVFALIYIGASRRADARPLEPFYA